MFSNFHGTIRRGLVLLAAASLVVTVPAVSHAGIGDNGGIPNPALSMLSYTTNGSPVSESPTTEASADATVTYHLASNTTKIYFSVNSPSDAGSTFTVPFFQASGVSVSYDTMSQLALGDSTGCSITVAQGGGPCGGVLDGSGHATFTLSVSGVSSSSSVKFQLNGATAKISKFAVLAFNGTSTGPAPTGTPTSTASATPTSTSSVPASVKISLASTTLNGPGYSVGNGWYHGNAPANNWVQYVIAGQTFTLSYLVKNAANNTAVGAGVPVTLSVAKAGAGVANFSGSLAATTNESGIATFTLTSTNTDSAAENARADLTSWTDVNAGTPEYKADFTPSVTGASAGASAKDLVWTHTIKSSGSTPTPTSTSSSTPTPTAPSAGWNVRLTTSGAVDQGYMGWFQYYAAGVAYNIKHVTVGTSQTLTYHVTNGSDAAASQSVTLVFGKQFSTSTANVTVGNTTSAGEQNKTVTGTTDANGDVSFTLVNNDSSVGSAKLFTQVAAYIVDASKEAIDITDIVYDPVGGVTPTPTMGTGWVSNPDISWMSATSNGTAVTQSSSSTAYVFASDTTRINFSLHSPNGAGQTFQVVPFDKSNVSVSVATLGSAQGSPTACDPDVANGGAGCMGSFDASGNATFAFTVSGISSSSLFKVQINGANATISTFATIAFNGTAASATPTPTPTATATPTPTPTPTVSAPLVRAAARVLGTAKVGTTVTASRGTWTGATSYSYKWYSCSAAGSAKTSAPSGCTVLARATTASMRLPANVKGKFIRVQVKGTNSAGSAYSYSATSLRVK